MPASQKPPHRPPGLAFRAALGALALAMAMALLAPGCSGSRPREMPTAQAGVRVIFADYSILPPAGYGWRVAARRRDAIVFGQLASATHSLVALTSEKTTDRNIASQAALMAYVKSDWEKSDWKHDPRYEKRQTDLQPDSRFGPYCVRYKLQSEDHGAANRGKAPFLLQRSLGLICYQPKRPRHLVHAGYTERGRPDEMDDSFTQDAEHFLSGLRLADLP